MVALNVECTIYLHNIVSAYDHKDHLSWLRYCCKRYYRIFYPAGRFLYCRITQVQCAANPRKFTLNIRVAPAPTFRVLEIVEVFRSFVVIDQDLAQLGY